MKIAMLGSGAWGTALANLLCENGHRVTLWNRDESRVRAMEQTRKNPRLPGTSLHPAMELSWDPACAADCQMVVFAVPSFAIRQTAALVCPYLKKDVTLVSVTKGIEAESGLRMTQIIGEETGMQAAALSGPSVSPGVVVLPEEAPLLEDPHFSEP